MTCNGSLRFVIELIALALFIDSITPQKIYLVNKIILSYIYHALPLPHRVVFFSKFFIKIIITFLDICTICPKIFAKLDYFATLSQMGVAISALMTFS